MLPAKSAADVDPSSVKRVQSACADVSWYQGKGDRRTEERDDDLSTVGVAGDE